MRLRNSIRLEESDPIAQAVTAKAVKETANGSLCSGARMSEAIAAKRIRLKRIKSRKISASICRILAVVCPAKIAGANHFQIRWVRTHVS